MAKSKIAVNSEQRAPTLVFGVASEWLLLPSLILPEQSSERREEN